MLRNIDGQQLDVARLGPLKPERILFEFDGPRTWLANDPEGELLLLHQCGESPDAAQFFVVPFSETLVHALEAGDIDLRDALDQPRLWIAEFDRSGVRKLVRSSFAKLPNDWIPESGVMLFPELEPLLSIRSLGRDVELGHANLGLLKTSLDNARSALKTLADYAVGVIKGPGQPKTRTRQYYDLPARLLSDGVKVCVYPRVDSQKKLFDTDDVWQRMEELLNRGLDQISNLGGKPSDDSDHDLQIAFTAIDYLAPPSWGAVEKTEISGRLLSARSPMLIDRSVRAVIRQRLREPDVQTVEIIQSRGTINQLDMEEATCLLRDDQGVTLHKLSFEERLYEVVKDAFDSGCDVRITARTISSASEVVLLAVEPSVSVVELLAVEFSS